ncbi:hypothetical protein CKA55_07945 [Arcobacter suis]|uniref:Apea-like HEPN domain-containing protein n=1 Tax=Arcobacter suis CECT 7833 TaxID=663365 RepID=A0AAD0SRZ2_9BACT|nr:HEPN domain-containing protein [Arcobacter suis]AXX89885.1 hypothetical protein ASUIS_1403 [Arcobacter suis CECT 7833]RWS46395.1 hypothetical protein CKA55_07945 [Arcobacter suis]
MDFKYECLLLINKEKQSVLYNLCDDDKSFLKILEKENIKAKENKLLFNEIEYRYTLKINLIEEKVERYFHFKVICENEEKLENYIKFLKELRKIFNIHNFDLEILRNDLPLYYSKQAYVLINKLENHMRKFIKYFLITKVGINWIEETAPKEIEIAIKNKEVRDKEDKLKRLDFDELGAFLFTKYSKRNPTELQKLINEKKVIDLTILQEFVQESNWEKYFNENIKCENDYLKTRWEKLYIYRNNIAHNKNFNNTDLKEVERLYKEVNEKLKEAFDGIDKIKDTNIDKIGLKNVLESLSLENTLLLGNISGLNNTSIFGNALGFANSFALDKTLTLENTSISELTNSLIFGNTSVSEFIKALSDNKKILERSTSSTLDNYLSENKK